MALLLPSFWLPPTLTVDAEPQYTSGELKCSARMPTLTSTSLIYAVLTTGAFVLSSPRIPTGASVYSESTLPCNDRESPCKTPGTNEVDPTV